MLAGKIRTWVEEVLTFQVISIRRHQLLIVVNRLSRMRTLAEKIHTWAEEALRLGATWTQERYRAHLV